jgi:hypothetical protein
MKKRMLGNERGLGLLAAVTLLTILALSIGVLAPAVYEVTVADKMTNTGNDLQALKVAVTGNPNLVVNGGRSDFGYVGTMGNPPSQLSNLWLQGSQLGYGFNTTVKVGAGWVGPYVPSAFVEDLLALDKDRFGNPFIFTSTPFTRSSDGQTVAIRIQSSGPDGIANTADDQIEDILQGEVYSTVTGTLKQGTTPVKFAGVALNYPSNGAIASTSATTNTNGIFTFNNVSFGFRSISVSPLLLYKDGTITTPDGNTSLQFTLTNAATNDVTVTSLNVNWDTSAQGNAYYEQILFAGKKVFDYTKTPYNGNPGNNTRAPLGQTIYFQNDNGTPQPVTVTGSHKPNQAIPIRVDQQFETTPDLLISSLGQSVTVKLVKFNTAQTGGGTGKIVSGFTFTVTLSDGSVNTITAP